MILTFLQVSVVINLYVDSPQNTNFHVHSFPVSVDIMNSYMDSLQDHSSGI